MLSRSLKLTSISQKPKKTTEFAVLAVALDHLQGDTEQERYWAPHGRWSIDNPVYHTDGTTIDGTFNYDAYLRRLRLFVEAEELQDHIEITTQRSPTHIVENASHYLTKHKITIKNLHLTVPPILWRDDGKIHLDHLSIDEYYPPEQRRIQNRCNGGLHIEFVDNTFEGHQGNGSLQFGLGTNCLLSFESNLFNNTSVYIVFKVWDSSSFLKFTKNTFNSYRVNIGGPSLLRTFGREEPVFVSGDWTTKPNDLARIYGSRLLSGFINERRTKKYKEKPPDPLDDPGYEPTMRDLVQYFKARDSEIPIEPDIVRPNHPCKCAVLFESNQLRRLELRGAADWFLMGRNTIEELATGNEFPRVFIGAFQNFDSKGLYAHTNKRFFAKLKTAATDNNDASQIRILGREMIKCDRHIAEREPIWQSFQDRLIYIFGACSSDYGVSWIRPLLLLTILNLALTVIYLMLQCPSMPFCIHRLLPAFIEMFNPISSIAVSDDVGKNGWAISLLNVVQKIGLGYFYFEIIKVFRRLGRT